MKLLIILSGLVSFMAYAEILKFECTFKDYVHLNKALNTYKARDEKTKSLVPGLKSLLAEEMGPKCNRVLDTQLGTRIPGSTYSDYEVYSPTSYFSITVVEEMETQTNFLTIFTEPFLE